MSNIIQSNPYLSIVIPTYNRAKYLDYCLKVHIPLAKDYNIQIVVSDNASTDNTKEIVLKWRARYSLVYYYCNETNIGPDKNIEKALKYPKTKYVWLLGDTYQIPEEGIIYVIDLIQKKQKEYDVIVLNVGNRVREIPEQDYSDHNMLLSDLGWHMTCLSSLIYNSSLINQADFKRYYDTNFIQEGIIFEHIAKREFLIHWAKDISLKGIKLEGIKKESWENNTFEIWTKRWANFIFSLPTSYELKYKFKCIKDHGAKSGLFKIMNLFNLRRKSILDYAIYREYSDYFSYTIKYPKIILMIISLIPKSVFAFAYRIYKFTKVITDIKSTK